MFGVAMEAGPKQILSPESAAAIAFFDQFVNAQTFKGVLGTFRLLCDSLRIKPTNFPNFYPKLKAKLRSWKANALWAKIEKRANHKCYNRGKACANTRILIIGAGPCGLRTAIEAQLLGAKVVVIEKRDRLSRNNVLHLWPFVIHDLRNLGAKKFYGKFCVGAIDHISIRQLQCVLLKVALLIGVEVHENVSFDDLIEPPLDQSQEKIGWKPLITPRDHPVSQYEFDVLIGADGKRNTLKSFKRKEFRGKLAIAITANFINRHSEAEARVQEISGVAFIFNQKFFQDLKEHTGIDLENIVYYKDETHYFVMTAKKYSLIEKGVILNDYADTAKLLAPDNVSREALLEYAREAAEFSTNFQMPNLEFAVNHYGQADVAMFDFTSMFAAESASRVVERRGHKLLQALVGDSLLEPFWPTGSGCARGFLSSLDACWMIRSWSLGCMTPFQVLAQRESIYRLLAQTKPENLSKDYNDYTIDPTTRYPNLNLNAVLPVQVKGLYDTDSDLKDEPLEIILPKKKRKRDSHIHPDTLLSWCQRQVILYRNVSIENMTISWRNGLALCAIIHRYRPDLIDFNSLHEDDAEKNNQSAFDICEREFGILPIMTGKEMAESTVPDALAIVSYVSQIYDNFRGEIPYVVRAPLTDLSPEDRPPSPSRKSPSSRFSFFSRLGQRLGSKKRYSVEKMDQEIDKEKLDALKRAKKKRSLERDRALFILNKDSVQPTLTSYKKKEETTIEDRENFNSRVKDLEEKLYGTGQKFVPSPSNAPKVGKIGRGDWNVKMLEERLKGTKPPVKKERIEVPKWSRDIFEDKLRALNQKPRSDSPEEPAKFTDFDSRLHMLDKKLKEGNNLEIGQRGMNKVSAMAEHISATIDTTPQSLPLQRSNSKPSIPMVNVQNASEVCHFCNKRVYLMERHSAQGKFFHRGCFKCEYCNVSLRLGNYGVGTEGHYIGKFLCMHHFNMRIIPRKRPSAELGNETKRNAQTTPTKLSPVSPYGTPPGNNLDIPDSGFSKMRGITPERVEFENTLDLTSEEELLSEIDEDDWTERNFGTSAAENDSSEEESDFSSDEMKDEEIEEALQNSLSSDQTLQLAESWKRRHFKRKGNDADFDELDSDEEYDESDDDISYEEYENEDDESTATEGEVHDGAGEGPSEQMISPSDEMVSPGDVELKVPQQPDKKWESVDYQTLKSTEESGSEEENDSKTSDSELFSGTDSETESDTEDGDQEEGEQGIEGDKESDADENGLNICRTRNRKRRHFIPTIVIDEMTSNALNEDDDSYFITLQEQNLKAEKTLGDLIHDQISESAVQTPETPLEPFYIRDEICPLVPMGNQPSFSEQLGEEKHSSSIPSEHLNNTTLTTKADDNQASVTSECSEILKPVTKDEHLTSQSQNALDQSRALEQNNLPPVKLPSEIGKSQRPNSFVESLKTLEQIDKMFSSESDVTIGECEVEENVVVEMETNVRLPEQAKSQDVVASLPDRMKAKENDKDIRTTGNSATESPTSKMMLKLKERYLLGNATSPEPSLSTVSPHNTQNMPSKLEPVVKSFLEVISEKQKMLSPALTPSQFSPSSQISSSSEPSNLQGSSSWSRFSPVSPLGLYSTSGSLSPCSDSKSVDICCDEKESKPETSSVCETSLPEVNTIAVDVETTHSETEDVKTNVHAPSVGYDLVEGKDSVDDKPLQEEATVDNCEVLQIVGSDASRSTIDDNLNLKFEQHVGDQDKHAEIEHELEKEPLAATTLRSSFNSEVVEMGSDSTDIKVEQQQVEVAVDADNNEDIAVHGANNEDIAVHGVDDNCENISPDTGFVQNSENGNSLPDTVPNESHQETLNNDSETQVSSMKDDVENLPLDESFFDNIDTRFITFRDKKIRDKIDSNLAATDDITLSCSKEICNDESGEINSAESGEINTDKNGDSVPECDSSNKLICYKSSHLDNDDSSGNKDQIMPESTSTTTIHDDNKIELGLSNVQTQHSALTGKEIKVLHTGEHDNESLKNEEDDLMGMLSSSISSDSDTTPSLDESIYTTPQAVIKPVPKQLSYLGHFAEHSFPFGGVRDSIDIRKSAMKKGPATIITTQNGSYILDNSNYDNKQLQDGISQMQSAIIAKSQEPQSGNMCKDIKSSEPADEIPFADDESSQESSERTQKKDKFSTPKTSYKRPLQRPLSMIETRSSLGSPLLTTKNIILPDTPLTKPEMFSTPGTMVEAIEDLRQLRTVEREKARQLARERARLKSDEELGLRAVDYKKLRKKYQKSDSNASSDIQEEKTHMDESQIEGELEDNMEMSLSPDSVENSDNVMFPDSKTSSSQSSSPDSEVFESSSPLVSPCEVEKTSMSPTSEGSDVVPKSSSPLVSPCEVEKTSMSPTSEGSDVVPKSSSIGSSVTASFSDANKDSAPTSGSTSLTSKTDCAAYLEPELSIEEVDLKISTDSNQKSTSSGSSIANSPTKIKSSSLPGLISRKEKTKNLKVDNSVLDKSDKGKPKERKSLLSIFANFGRSDSLKSKTKEKEDKEKKKEKPGNNSQSPAGLRETLQTSAISPLEGAGLKVDGTPKESRFPKLRLARSKEKAKEKRKQKYLAHSEKEDSQSPSKEVPLASREITPSSKETTPSSKETTPSSKDLTPSPKEMTPPPKEISQIKESLPIHQVNPSSQSRESASLNMPSTNAESSTSSTCTGLKSGEMTFDRHALIASLASISRQIPSENKHENGVAPQASEDSFSDPDDDNVEEKSHASSTSSSKKSKAISEERKRKYERLAQRMYRQQEQKRLRTAQEIQRQLEELEVKQRELEMRGVQVEKALRGEGKGQDARKEEPELMQEWFHLVHSKNVLVRKEQELMVKAKELELEDRHSRLQHQLHQRMAIDDSTKTPEEIDEEGRILTEMLEIVDQRDTLIAFLEENRQSYQEQDRDLELSMQAKGLMFSSSSKS